MKRQHNCIKTPRNAASTAKRCAFGIALALALVLVPTQTSQAQGGISVTVGAIHGFMLDMPAGLAITTATPGQDPDAATASTTWGFTSNGNTVRNLTASLAPAPPAGLSISIDLGTPTDSDAIGAGASVGSASVGSFDSSDFEDIMLWSGAQKARASGTAEWTASASVELGDEDDYSGTMTLTFE